MAGQVATRTTRRELLLPAIAVLGAAFIAYQLWGYLAWALDGGSTPFEIGGEVPDASRSAVLLGQVLMPLLTLGWLTYVGSGLLRERALTWPAALTVVWGLTYWQESLANVTGARFAYNAEFVDRGDWTTYLPFVTDSGPGLPQPLLMEPAVFVGLLPLISWGSYLALRGLRARTGWSAWLVVPLVYVAVLAVEFGAEMRSIAQGVHSYPEVFGALSIRDRAADQFPLYENWLLGLMWFLPGLALFLLHRPSSLVEEGAERSSRNPSRTMVLAGVGALNVAFLLYNLIAFVWLPADTVAPMPPWLNP